MARRNNTSVVEDLFGIAAALPWWMGVGMALISYIVLHRYAVVEVPTNAATAQIGQMITGQMMKSFATFGQYLVPFVLLAGSLASFTGRRKRESLVRNAAQGNTSEALRNMNWQDFELAVGEVFRSRGFSVTEMGGGGADGGIDLQLKKGGEVFLVQCKQWRAYKVSVSVVRELYGVMAAQGAAGGFVVTSGVFTADARSFTNGRNIELIDGQALSALIKKTRRAGIGSSRTGTNISTNSTVDSQPAILLAGKTGPACPRCGGTMIERIAKQGVNAGKSFWGCSAFPKCYGARTVE